MEEACGSLEIEFRRIANDLRFITHRVESDYRAVKCPNPLLISKRLASLEKRLLLIQEKMLHLEIMKSRELSVLRSLLDLSSIKQVGDSTPVVSEAFAEANSCRELLADALKVL